MGSEKYLAIRRDDRYSPNSIEADRLILQLVCAEIEAIDNVSAPIRIVDEAEFARCPQFAEHYLFMARSAEALQKLSEREQQGACVVNAAQGVRNCRRSLLDRMMRQNGFSMPPAEGWHGYWLKRGDAAAQSVADVVFCQDVEMLEAAQKTFRARGIDDYVVSTHVPGDLIKFYGVERRMFRYFYPADDGISKFGDEALNGKAHHYAFDEEALRGEIVRLAEMTGVCVYGGDAIVDSQGQYHIIDFNDWPSFSRCRQQAARAIALAVTEK